MKQLTSRLFIEKDDDDNHEVVIRVGPVVNETEAVNIASYIYVTQKAITVNTKKAWKISLRKKLQNTAQAWKLPTMKFPCKSNTNSKTN